MRTTSPRTEAKYLFTLTGTLILARILFVWLMPYTYSKDLASWLRVMDILDAGGNPYGQTEVLNWPPFWMQILYGIDQLSKLTGIPRWPLVQAVLTLGELMVVGVVWIVGRRQFDHGRLFRGLLFGIAINPICIFLTCQHCNYDVFVGLWVALTAWVLIDFSAKGNRDSWLMACFFIGMGILTKTIPIILTPLLLVGIRSLPTKTRLFGLLLLATPLAIGMSLLITLEPAGVMKNVVGYRSLAGWYGITGIFNLLHSGDAMTFYQRCSPFLFLAVILYTAWKCYRSPSLTAPQVIVAMLLLLLFIPTFGPGYSPPYILWYLPLLILFYCFATVGIRRLIIVGWVIGILTYCTEYAFFDSHGAFLTKMFPSQKMTEWSDYLGSSSQQVLIRIPLFLFYITLFIVSLKYLAKHETMQPVPVSS